MNPNARENQICGRCEHFTLQNSREKAAEGIGYCPLQWEWRHWKERGCVIFGPALDQAARTQWIGSMEENSNPSTVE